MNVGLRFSLAGALVLVSLSGCGRGFFQDAERAPWRHQAEVACLKSGEVKLGQGAVQIEPIEGPGVCGADFPLRVTALGDSSALGFADEMRPPAAIPGGASADMPRWPAPAPRYASPPPAEHLRWVVGPQPVNAPDDGAPTGEPMSIAAPEATSSPPSYAVPPYPAPRMAARPPSAPSPSARPDDIPPDAVIPPGGSAAVPEPPAQPSYRAPPQRRAYNAPGYEPVPQPRELPRLGPARGYTPIAMPQATLMPPATLSCPIVSALDRWVSEGVQPAALHWFGSPVTTIRQIGSYSCRSMVGAAGHHISEHAFGDALDIAGFTFADGRTITVKNGWHGSPEEQGFLHDVQLYACETFDTVLAPGYNVYHYDHIHVDLMRRASGKHPCRPNAIAGEVVAARARAHYASRQRAPAYTGSIAAMIDNDAKAPVAIPGADGYVADDDDDAGVTGSIPWPSAPMTPAAGRPQDRLTQIY
jgi:hypothetical protein